jgi:hypothetical protein
MPYLEFYNVNEEPSGSESENISSVWIITTAPGRFSIVQLLADELNYYSLYFIAL